MLQRSLDANLGLKIAVTLTQSSSLELISPQIDRQDNGTNSKTMLYCNRMMPHTLMNDDLSLIPDDDVER